MLLCVTFWETFTMTGEIHVPLLPLPTTSRWQPGRPRVTALDWDCAKIAVLLLTLVGTGGQVDKGAFLALRPWGSQMSKVGISLPPPSPQPLQLFLHTESSVIDLKPILTMAHPWPQTSHNSPLPGEPRAPQLLGLPSPFAR